MAPGGRASRGYMSAEEKAALPKITWPLIKRVLSYLTPYWKQFVLVLACIAVSSVMGLLPSILTGKIIDEGGISNYYIFSSQWDANLVIEGGEFIPSASKPTFDWFSGSVTLKGGTFHENPCATNGVIIDDEYMLKENGNGTWTVIPMEDPNVPSDGDEAVEPETT